MLRQRTHLQAHLDEERAKTIRQCIEDAKGIEAGGKCIHESNESSIRNLGEPVRRATESCI